MTEKQAIKILKDEKSWESDDRKIDAFIMGIEALKEIQSYRAIGTPDEFRVAVERMKPKKPIFKFEYEDGRQFYDCPVCGAYVMHAGVQSKERYCSNCSTKLDWSE